jgi:hypothetical protein
MPGTWNPDDVVKLIINPIYAINIHETLALPHETMLSEDEWVAANAKMITDLGPELYLRTLLGVLKGDYV